MVDVSIIPCNSYNIGEVDNAVRKAFELIKIPKNKTVLLKPNLLGVYKSADIVTTNPVIIESICKILKKNKNRVLIGDSSFKDTEKTIRKSGLLELAKKYNVEIVNFDKSKQVLVKNNKAEILKKFYLPEEILKADYIISIPKLKTHFKTKLTCAIKNSYGMIAGTKKQYYHEVAKSEKDFCQLLLDIYQRIKADFVIVDAVVGMEGDGAVLGDAKKTNLILASTNQIAIDMVVCDIIGLDRKEVLTNKIALDKKIFTDKIRIVGKVPKIPYKMPITYPGGFFLNKLTPPKKLSIDRLKCILCHSCENGCPVKAIELRPYPKIDTKKCIRCFCCIEACPQIAIYLKSPFGFLNCLIKFYHFCIKLFLLIRRYKRKLRNA